MTDIDTSAEACERLAAKLWPMWNNSAKTQEAAAALIRQLVRERDEARERALDEAATCLINECHDDMTRPEEADAILALKGPKP